MEGESHATGEVVIFSCTSRVARVSSSTSALTRTNSVSCTQPLVVLPCNSSLLLVELVSVFCVNKIHLLHLLHILDRHSIIKLFILAVNGCM